MDDSLFRVLKIDLSKMDFSVEIRKELFLRYLGGVGVGVKLFEEELDKNSDPLGPGNVIVLAVGAMTALYPFASKTVAIFRSPLTGNYGESHAGGRSAAAIRMAGYGAIVIKGAADHPVYLDIDEESVRFRDARALWGMKTDITGRVIRERAGKEGFRSIIRIGPAGEKLIRYSSAVVETYRHFGRLGIGAVMGSKKLKAIVISGRRTIKVEDKVGYRRIYEKIFSESKGEFMKKYHDLGTPMNVMPLNEIGALPTMNLKHNRFDKAYDISGESIASKRLGRRLACSHCPTACIHIAALREPYEEEPYFYKTEFVSYDYEPIYALGSMLGIGDVDGLLKLIKEVDRLGLDAISTGVVLSWATEALERGILRKEDVIVDLKWGDYEKYIEAVNLIVKGENEFYKYMGLGVEAVAAKYGGLDFALSFGGNEMAGYHTGPAAYATNITGARHSHLDSAGYSLDQEMLKEGKMLSPADIAIKLFEEESWRQVLCSLVVCLFSRKIYKPDVVRECLEPLGLRLSEENLVEIGREILISKNKIKEDLGFSFDRIRLPRRIFEIDTPLGRLDEGKLMEIVRKFRELLKS
jgi:aldehyde:ferredoxin oxidoreductase